MLFTKSSTPEFNPKQSVMSMLETLPIELFQEIASYLHFLDKKALSIASKKCNTMTGMCECPDQLTWLIHLCGSPARVHGPLCENPKVFRDLVFTLPHYLAKNLGFISLQTKIEELVLPYFPRRFPQDTLLYYYMTVARDFAKSVLHGPNSACLDTTPSSNSGGLGIAQLPPRFYWIQIERESAHLIEWLEQQKPTDLQRRNAVSHVCVSTIDVSRRRA